MNTNTNLAADGAVPIAVPVLSVLSLNNTGTRILVVEDDPAILNLNLKVLRKAGYTAVDSAMNGEEGWKALCSKGYDLLITDLNMPKMNGAELIDRLRSAKMELPIILATGAAISDEMAQGEWYKTVSLLQKPFTNLDLLGKIKQALEK